MGQPIQQIGDVRAEIELWLKARAALASGQSYSIGGRTLTRQDLETVNSMLTQLDRTLKALEAAAAGQVRPFGAQAAFPAPGRGTGGSGTIYPNGWWTDWRN